MVESVRLTATVKAIDARNRTLTIDPKYGDEQTVKAPPEMINFDQISVGDEIALEIVEEIAVRLIHGGAAESAGALEGIALAPVGTKPAIAVVSSRELTADVIAIDAHSHAVTLEFIDGSVGVVQGRQAHRSVGGLARRLGPRRGHGCGRDRLPQEGVVAVSPAR